MKISKNRLLLYAVTDSRLIRQKELSLSVEKAILGGATCVQLRDKENEDGELLRQAFILKELCSRYNVPLIINDRVDIALKAGADGVHIGQDDMDLKNARKLLGDKMIIGVTAHNLSEAVRAEREGADYLGVGAAFLTGTKKDAVLIPHGAYKEICASVKIPVVAIGGINAQNVKELRDTGISGIAVVSAVFGTENIRENCEELLKLAKEVTEK